MPIVLTSSKGNDDEYDKLGWTHGAGGADVVLVVLERWTAPRKVTRLADQEALLLSHIKSLEGKDTYGAGLDKDLVAEFAAAYVAGEAIVVPRAAPVEAKQVGKATKLNADELLALDNSTHVALLVYTSSACDGNALCDALLAAWDDLARDYDDAIQGKATIATFDVDANDAPKFMDTDVLPAPFYFPPDRHDAPLVLPPTTKAAVSFRANFDKLVQSKDAAAASTSDATEPERDEL